MPAAQERSRRFCAGRVCTGRILVTGASSGRAANWRGERFASVERYRLIAKDLRRLYKIGFDSALRMAQLAEQAYRAERQDDGAPNEDDMLAGGYWDAQNGGLFAGEKLLADLRITGECSFSIPEWFFDLSYPGQYRRRVRAVRLTMPCVTGPYTNCGATLRLDRSKIRGTAPTNPTDGLAERIKEKP